MLTVTTEDQLAKKYLEDTCQLGLKYTGFLAVSTLLMAKNTERGELSTVHKKTVTELSGTFVKMSQVEWDVPLFLGN